jgi:hypothetical protein
VQLKEVYGLTLEYRVLSPILDVHQMYIYRQTLSYCRQTSSYINTTLRVYLIVHDWKQIRLYWCEDRLSRLLVLTQEVQWHAKGVIYKTNIITLQINIVMFQTNIIYTRKTLSIL